MEGSENEGHFLISFALVVWTHLDRHLLTKSPQEVKQLVCCEAAVCRHSAFTSTVCDSNHRLDLTAVRTICQGCPCFRVGSRGDWGRGKATPLVKMTPSNQHSVRLVMQHVCENTGQRSFCGLVAYSDQQTYQHSQFHSLDELLKVLDAASPGFDASSFSQRRGDLKTSIVFATEMELSDKQLSLLGLKDGQK